MQLSNLRLAIGVPCTFPTVPLDFFSSFVMMEKPDFEYIPQANGPIHALRNNIVERAMAADATKIMMCDVDQVYHPQTIMSLLSHNLPIVGALVHRRYVPFDSLMMKKVEIDERTDTYQSIDEWEEDELVEVDATGTGCIMYDMQVFKDMPYPWFKAQYNPDGSPIGEDFGFCQDLKAKGYRIFVDTSVPAGHLATMIVNTATNRLYRASKSAQAVKLALFRGDEESDVDIEPLNADDERNFQKETITDKQDNLASEEIRFKDTFVENPEKECEVVKPVTQGLENAG